MPGMSQEKRKKYFDIPKGKFAKEGGKGDATRGSVAAQRAGNARIFGEKCPTCRTNSKRRVQDFEGKTHPDYPVYWCEPCKKWFEVM